MQHLDIPRGMKTSASYDNLGLANPRVQMLKTDRDGHRGRGDRRGSAPFIQFPQSAQNSPKIHRKMYDNLERQYSRSAHNSPLPTRAKMSKNFSAVDLRRVDDEQKLPRSRTGSVDHQNIPFPVRSRRGSHADVADVVPNNGKSKDKTTPNGVEKTLPKTSNGDVEKGMTSPPSPTSPPTPPTSPRSPNSPRSSKKCAIRSILKYLCVIVFLVCVAVIAFVIYQQVTKSNKHGTASHDTTTKSTASQ